MTALLLIGALQASELQASGLHASGLPTCAELHAQDHQGQAPEPMVGTVRNTARLALRVYQVLISPADGAGCSFYPSCSGYTLRAVRRYGPIMGSVMGTERIMRDHGSWGYTRCTANGRVFDYDPPQDNAPRIGR